jgi:hypothetical protein
LLEFNVVQFVPVKTRAGAKRRQVIVGATGVDAGPGVYPKILNTLLGTKFKINRGYATAGMRLAMGKNEIEGICGQSPGRPANPLMRIG